MKVRDRIIIGLLVCGLAVFSFIHFVTIPKMKQNDAKHQIEQLDASTHDLHYILKYKHQYMGAASNIINLFRHLPLNIDSTTFELLSDDLTLRVLYKDKLDIIGAQIVNAKASASEQTQATIQNEVQKSLIYNSTAAYALIDNLECIEYQFLDVTYQVVRADVENLYKDFSAILTDINWNSEVQRPLSDSTYVSKTFDTTFKTK